MSSEGPSVEVERADQGPRVVPKLRFPEFVSSGTWTETPLGATCEPIQEKVGGAKLTPVSITAGHGFVSQASKFGRDISGDQYRNYIYLKKGDFAYNKGNSKKFPQGYVCQLFEFEEAAASSAFICFRLKGGYEPRFFQAVFDQNTHGRQLARYITSGARSDGLLNIRPEDFYSVKVALPPKQGEQQKIAACLSLLDALISAEADKLAALKDHKKGLMQQLFPSEGEGTPRLRFPEFQDAGDWQQANLGSFGKLVTGLTYSPSDVRERGLLVLRSSNIRDGKIDLSDCVYVDPGVRRANKVKPDDILVCVRNGSTSLIGKNALIPAGMPRCTHGAFMTIFRSSSAKFVFQLFQTSAYQRQVAADLGATINSINGAQFLKYQFRFPSNQEQHKISEFLSSIDALIAAEADKLAGLKDHKKGLMQQLFPPSGEASV